MLNALSTALFTLALRLASEANKMPAGLLALASNPRLSPALAALFKRACPLLDSPRTRAAVQHVARHLHPPFPGKTGVQYSSHCVSAPFFSGV
jgi:hypothetical protein